MKALLEISLLWERGEKPNPLKGKLSEVNHQSVETTQDEDISTLIHRLRQAQEMIEMYIPMKHITLIPYKKGSRSYSRSEHLDVVHRHIKRHLKDLRKTFLQD